MVQLGSRDGALALFRGSQGLQIVVDKAVKISVKVLAYPKPHQSLFDIAKTLAHFGGLFYAPSS